MDAAERAAPPFAGLFADALRRNITGSYQPSRKWWPEKYGLGTSFMHTHLPPFPVGSHACCHQLFREAGVSQRLYDEFLEPMLLVLPMCPGEDCSAAAALSCFQYFALEHQARCDSRNTRV